VIDKRKWRANERPVIPQRSPRSFNPFAGKRHIWVISPPNYNILPAGFLFSVQFYRYNMYCDAPTFLPPSSTFEGQTQHTTSEASIHTCVSKCILAYPQHRCDWPRNACFCMCLFTISGLWVFKANHSAVFCVDHQNPHLYILNKINKIK